MPYKDKEKAKLATKERVKRHREKNVTPSDVTPENVTPCNTQDVTPFVTHNGDLLPATPFFVPLSDTEAKELCRQHLEPHTFREIEAVIARHERLGIPEKDDGRWQRAWGYHQWSRF